MATTAATATSNAATYDATNDAYGRDGNANGRGNGWAGRQVEKTQKGHTTVCTLLRGILSNATIAPTTICSTATSAATAATTTATMHALYRRRPHWPLVPPTRSQSATLVAKPGTLQQHAGQGTKTPEFPVPGVVSTTITRTTANFSTKHAILAV